VIEDAQLLQWECDLKSRPGVLKRQKELRRKEKQREKELKREERRRARKEGPGGDGPEIAPFEPGAPLDGEDVPAASDEVETAPAAAPRVRTEPERA